MNYNKLTIEEFGRQLVLTGDLDPIYIMLSKASKEYALNRRDLCIWCVVYWCCYHAGVASAAVEFCRSRSGGNLWPFLHDVACNESRRWPRGSERRHFRGANATNLVDDLTKYSGAENFIDHLFAGSEPLTFQQVSERVQRHVGFGPWIAFKIADMGERVLGYQVDFSDCALGIYSQPVEGASLACDLWTDKTVFLPNYGKGWQQTRLKYALHRLSTSFPFPTLYAPPDYMRRLGVAEHETILCKFKSHHNGRYPIGKDTKEISHHLDGFGPLAEKMKTYLPYGSVL